MDDHRCSVGCDDLGKYLLFERGMWPRYAVELSDYRSTLSFLARHLARFPEPIVHYVDQPYRVPCRIYTQREFTVRVLGGEV